jgi:hypothetical protein
MATTQRRPRQEKPPTAGQQIVKGFDYLTLDPSPRLRRMREELGKSTPDPAEVVRKAWLTVGAAITEALRIIRASSQNR